MAFAASVRSAVLSTVDEEGRPFVSYAPFVRDSGRLYIYISRLAQHYAHLEANAAVDVLMIEDESQTPNVFARQRARFACRAENLGNEGCETIFERMEQTFGQGMIGMLRGLDFSLFELTPVEGRYIVGFGQAFDIDLEANRFEHIARDGGKQT